VRAVKVLPTQLLGVVADHGDLPVERIGVGGGYRQLTLEAGEYGKDSGKVCNEVGHKGRNEEQEDDHQKEERSRWWVGSVGHDEVLRLTDLGAFFHKGEAERGQGAEDPLSVDNHIDDEDYSEAELVEETAAEDVEVGEDPDSGEESEAPRVKKRKHKPEKNPLTVKKKGKNSVQADHTFFDGL
jgi:hypothetical protein